MNTSRIRQYRSFILALCMNMLLLNSICYSQTISYPWTISASLGYADYQKVHQGDHQTALGRFALGRDFVQKGPVLFGLEVGLQSGNQMRLKMTDEEIEAVGGLLVLSTLKPMLDGLITARITPEFIAPLFIQIKGGGAYRRWQMDRDTINDISQLAGELIAGFGYAITPNANISLSYQGIFGASPDVTIDLENGSGSVKNIPVQQAILLGINLMI